MSSWTHVAGIIRVDSIRLSDSIPDFDKLIGKECLWESDEKIWKDVHENPDKYLPMGSEGSLQKSIWVNPDQSYVASYTISIFGDLRDHYSAQKIVDWFKTICDKLWVRNAVITVDNDIEGVVTYTHKESDNESEGKECI